MELHPHPLSHSVLPASPQPERCKFLGLLHVCTLSKSLIHTERLRLCSVPSIVHVTLNELRFIYIERERTRKQIFFLIFDAA